MVPALAPTRGPRQALLRAEFVTVPLLNEDARISRTDKERLVFQFGVK